MQTLSSHPFLSILMELVKLQEYETCHRLLGIIVSREQRACKEWVLGTSGVENALNGYYFSQFEKLLKKEYKSASADIALLVLYSQLFNFCYKCYKEENTDQFNTDRHTKFLFCLFDEIASRFLNSGTLVEDTLQTCEVSKGSTCFAKDYHCILRLLMEIVEEKMQFCESLETIGDICLSCVINGIRMIYGVRSDTPNIFTPEKVRGALASENVKTPSMQAGSISRKFSMTNALDHNTPLWSGNSAPMKPQNVIEELLTPRERYMRDECVDELSDDLETLLRYAIHLLDAKEGHIHKLLSQIKDLFWSFEEKVFLARLDEHRR
ncbi:hypothetical protein BEWA_035630 [Theileria equi strain WA]|uniref:Uncharacterized protein n=1 Tax=Theileria equi strain WA TaxID=1537102 RepID=L1LDK2_THEEQ|nr:hypothetical protein BEWA_035630 [Theileria equi strain WA]EKX73527.1 hypothetical protein BEWA_035630 [Theileria equi strain WA]|eukprot:XP_004832979.1 hypothetical protein BEWA_035630 [Theileria equi strain WA]